MSNTGKKIVLTLKQINAQTFFPTGLTEPNTPGDPNYIPPYNDFITCPISNSLACPLPVFTGGTLNIGFEFSVFNSVISNPQVSAVRVTAISQSIDQGHVQFSLPHVPTNYFSGSINVSSAGIYSMNIQYFSGSSVLTTCTNTSSIVVGGIFP